MVFEWASVVIGLVLLVFAGDALVKGAVNLALRLGVPALVVSLTVVAFGTSAPELLVGVQAVLDGAPGLALGNIVGSNIANVLLVLGVPALIATLHTGACEVRRDYAFMLAATVLFIGFCLTGTLVWWHGIVLLIVLAAILITTFVSTREADADVEGADDKMAGWKVGAFLVGGLIGLPLGASLLVDGATAIARVWGVSEAVIGLTLVAIGTSLPELATTVMAAIRRHADVALGNVIGSNLFNLLGIMGVTVLVGPVPVDPGFLKVDLWVMLGATLFLVPFVFMRRDVTRIWGVVLVGLYLAFMGSVLT